MNRIDIKLEQIKKEVERTVKVKDISLKSKKHDLPIWRGLYCKLAWDYTDYPLRVIGNVIDINHAAVVYWRDSFENLFVSRPDVEDIYKHTLRRLRLLDASQKAVENLDIQAENIIKSMLPNGENRKREAARKEA